MADERDPFERERSFSPDDILSDNSCNRLKRQRSERWTDCDADLEEDFIPVIRKTKRQPKNGGPKNDSSKPAEQQPNGSRYAPIPSTTTKTCEISMTSSDPLPKQMALAKLLRSLNIKDVIKIKYRSSYKVLITFENRTNAELLLQCVELKNRGFKCQKTEEMDSRYGIVRKVDLEFSDEELSKVFESDLEITAVWRLKRQTTEGAWVESETVRLCFKGTTIPPYVEAYGCRFVVEPYIFPVSQCSGCWRYGHRVKFCPLKKAFCPKCGSNHSNCETKEFKCINCKGRHMSIEKSKCPAFQKEKEIRAIMRDENCIYKKAYEMYQERETTRCFEEFISANQVEENDQPPRKSGNYREALFSSKPKRAENYEMETNDRNIPCNESREDSTGNGWQETKKKRKKSKNTEGQDNKGPESKEESEMSTSEKEKPKRKKAFNFMRLFNKIKMIVASENPLNEKITNLLSVVFEECYEYIAEFFKIEDYLNKILSIFKNG